MRAAFSSLIAVLLCLCFAGGAHAATISSIAFSADPTEDEPVTVTVAGTSEAGRRLFVLRQPSTYPCASTPYGDIGTWQTTSSGDALSGSFSKSYTFTPADAGTYFICAYIGVDAYSTPSATRSASVGVRLPQASIDSPAFSADPTEQEPVTVTVSGTSEAGRRLFVLRQPSTYPCGSTPYGDIGTWLTTSSGDAVSGAFSQSYSFTPSDAGTYFICAYVGEDAYATPLTTKNGSVTVRRPNA